MYLTAKVTSYFVNSYLENWHTATYDKCIKYNALLYIEAVVPNLFGIKQCLVVAPFHVSDVSDVFRVVSSSTNFSYVFILTTVRCPKKSNYPLFQRNAKIKIFKSKKWIQDMMCMCGGPVCVYSGITCLVKPTQSWVFALVLILLDWLGLGLAIYSYLFAGEDGLLVNMVVLFDKLNDPTYRTVIAHCVGLWDIDWCFRKPMASGLQYSGHDLIYVNA